MLGWGLGTLQRNVRGRVPAGTTSSLLGPRWVLPYPLSPFVFPLLSKWKQTTSLKNKQPVPGNGQLSFFLKKIKNKNQIKQRRTMLTLSSRFLPGSKLVPIKCGFLCEWRYELQIGVPTTTASTRQGPAAVPKMQGAREDRRLLGFRAP